MANMFSGNIEKTVPKTFDECTRPDSVSTNLWIWAERLETWGKVFFVIIIVIGIIATIQAGIAASEFIDVIGADSVEAIREESARLGMEIPTLFEAIESSLLQWGIYAFLEYCAYHVLALLIGALATITQNTRVSANVALFNAKEGVKETVTISSTTEKTAPTFVPPPAPTNTETWQCKHCGTYNTFVSSQCKGCGKYKGQ